MPFCQSCGQQLPDGAKFCSKCGAPQMTASGPQGTSPYTEATTFSGSRMQTQRGDIGSLKLFLLIPAYGAAGIGILITLFGAFYGVPAAGLLCTLLGVVIYFWPYRSLMNGNYRQAYIGSLVMGILFTISALFGLSIGNILGALLDGSIAGCLFYVMSKVKQ